MVTAEVGSEEEESIALSLPSAIVSAADPTLDSVEWTLFKMCHWRHRPACERFGRLVVRWLEEWIE
jgi:hypothetical protein